jgi:hypothetical protein
MTLTLHSIVVPITSWPMPVDEYIAAKKAENRPVRTLCDLDVPADTGDGDVVEPTAVHSCAACHERLVAFTPEQSAEFARRNGYGREPQPVGA